MFSNWFQEGLRTPGMFQKPSNDTARDGRCFSLDVDHKPLRGLSEVLCEPEGRCLSDTLKRTGRGGGVGGLGDMHRLISQHVRRLNTSRDTWGPSTSLTSLVFMLDFQASSNLNKNLKKA